MFLHQRTNPVRRPETNLKPQLIVCVPLSVKQTAKITFLSENVDQPSRA